MSGSPRPVLLLVALGVAVSGCDCSDSGLLRPEDCLELTDTFLGRFNDRDCLDELPVICERELDDW